MRIDCHNHADYSPDASQTLEELTLTAIARGVEYLAITEHMDLDFPNAERPLGEPIFDYRVTDKYFDEIARLSDKYKGKIEIVAGVEAGYTAASAQQTAVEIAKHPFGYVVNSVHICHGLDCYWQKYFEGYTQETAYAEYLDYVRASLDAPYRYDAVGHIGYIARPAPYAEKRLLYRDYADRIDDLLGEIVRREKILEINSSVGDSAACGALCLPDVSIVRRYYELGGRLINFGSDSHCADKFNKNYERVAEEMRRIGFKEWTIVRCGKLVSVRID